MLSALFYLFSCCSIVSGLMVISTSNSIHSVFFLIVVFFNCSGLLFLLGLDFFGIVLLVVYVGAIAVLFLFVVMMVYENKSSLEAPKEDNISSKSLYTVLGISSVLCLLSISEPESCVESIVYTDYSYLLNSLSGIEGIGICLYSYFALFLMLCGCILLVSMISAIVLTFSPNRGSSTRYDELSSRSGVYKSKL